MDANCWTSESTVSLALGPARRTTWRDRVGQAMERVLAWQDLARSRRQLAGLDDRLLQDIGLDRGVAAHEVERRFWQS